MERFIGTDTARVEIFFNIFTSGIETFVIPWDFNHCETHLRLSHSENADADRTGTSSGVRKAGNHWARGPVYRVDDD